MTSQSRLGEMQIESLEKQQERTADALLEGQGFGELLFDLVEDLVIILDYEGRIVRFNRSCEKATGYAFSEVRNTPFGEIFPDPDERTKNTGILWDMGEGSDKEECEYPILTKAGTIRRVVWKKTVLRDSAGNPKYLIGTGRDITDQREMEISIRRSESRYRSLFEDSGVALWEEDFSAVRSFFNQLHKLGVRDFKKYFAEHQEAMDQCLSQLRILDVNQAALDLFDAATKDELLARFPFTWTEKSRNVFQEELAVLAEGRSFLETETVIQTLHGEEKHALRRLTVPTGYQGSLSRVFVSMVDITKRKILEMKLRQMADLDSLTGILNRRSFFDRTDREIQRSKRYGSPLAVLYIDLDQFKKVNDTYGHQAGDHVIIGFTQLCLSCLRENDIFGRIGGEEFGIALIESDLDQAVGVAERLGELVRDNPVRFGQAEIHYTISCGAAQLKEEDQEVDGLMGRADKALYEAKRKGRNTVQGTED